MDIECTICRAEMKNSTTLPCTHNYCKACIEIFVSYLQQKGRTPFCPDCRNLFKVTPEGYTALTDHEIKDMSDDEDFVFYSDEEDIDVHA
ncbi:tripartite motif-containing protein 59-like [Teleopsis dalmanni]|uniref:tripartite motif-containing protein 59-like n=1 Tax=Teleopsis dalmanni TaxID=139649 RepID=UPI0018CD9FE3|nr:tripartite motif-containing protein 59-like [Teleopsis dalmanni]XP_037938176.1 tripartite motif-containing protein 59-like [Teleopsis dalmanni]XP_037940413.1 tripartite motif-containing protein 59-like [Teleopsis dalmanni]